MKKIHIAISLLLLIGLLAACNSNNEEESLNEELPSLDVEFDVPETADPGDSVRLEADVTYDGEPVEEADEVLFEIWKSGDQDNGEKIETENEGGGIYSLDYTFDEEGIYEMYAHTTAEALHTMPKKQIVIGDAEASEHEDHDSDEAHFHTEGFDMHFMEPDDVKAEEEVMLTTHIMLDEEALEDLNVRYEIAEETDEDNTDWVDASEDPAGEYSANYTFPQEGNYTVTVHVEDDNELHEHAEYNIPVK